MFVSKEERMNAYWVTPSSICHLFSHLGICIHCFFCLGHLPSPHTSHPWLGPLLFVPERLVTSWPYSCWHSVTPWGLFSTQYSHMIPSQGGPSTSSSCLKDTLRKWDYILQASVPLGEV